MSGKEEEIVEKIIKQKLEVLWLTFINKNERKQNAYILNEIM